VSAAGRIVAFAAASVVVLVATGCLRQSDDGTSPGQAADGSRDTPSASRPAAAVPTGPARTAGPVAVRPVELVAPAVRIRMPVLPTGVAVDGQMALPPDPRTIGWYRFGPNPGAPRGSAVLGGHLDSKEYGVGPLVRLRQLRPGDELGVRLTDGRTVRYRTVEVRSIAKQTLALAELFDRSGPARLRVVTCGGEYDRDRGGYQENVVVTAVPIR
jgi:Sortase domain